MKNMLKIGALALLMGLALTGCGSAFHNGTEMAIGTIKVTGLPTNPYAAGQKMVFSYNMGTKWVHDDAVLFADAKYISEVAADGTLTFNFSANPLIITTPQLTFILIDPNKGWRTLQIDKKHSGKSGGGNDATLDNQWTGTLSPLNVKGTISGDDVAWVFE